MERGCEHCRDQHGKSLPGRWADEFVLSDETIWFCGGGEERGISVNYCPWCGRRIREEEQKEE